MQHVDLDWPHCGSHSLPERVPTDAAIHLAPGVRLPWAGFPGGATWKFQKMPIRLHRDCGQFHILSRPNSYRGEPNRLWMEVPVSNCLANRGRLLVALPIAPPGYQFKGRQESLNCQRNPGTFHNCTDDNEESEQEYPFPLRQGLRAGKPRICVELSTTWVLLFSRHFSLGQCYRQDARAARGDGGLLR